MYNVLLTDDEQIVIDSLSFIISKNFEGMVNLKTALSGTEAIDFVTKHNIDIIFMDINMPGLNGLDTVSCIKKIKPDIIIIMLSAFDRFQYAQEAVNLGAFKYITKPVNRNVVIQTVQSAIDFIEAKRGKLTEDKELHKKLDFVSPMIESDFIYSSLFENDSSFDLDTYLDYFNIKNKCYCCCCFEIPNINSENQFSTYTTLRDLIKSEIECLVSSFIMNRIIVLYTVEEKNFSEEKEQEKIKKLFKLLNYKVSAKIKCGVSKFSNDWELIKDLYEIAIRCLNQCRNEGEIRFGEEEDFQFKNQNNTLEFKKQLILRFRQGDSSGVKSFLTLYCSGLVSSNTDLNKIKNSFFDIIITARNITLEINESFYSESFDNAFEILSKENDIMMLKDYLQKTLLEYMTAIASRRTQNENPIIKKVCAYINDNIAEDISLETMADYVNVSSFYLSKLFKEEMGVTFINFLSDRRLEKSRQMLKNTSKSIKEITAETGYNDQNYFSRLFKNKFGVSPTEFRNQL
ncbi:MAG: response regulator [Treponema sp.]|nr:response regulator [Treponema sp.]